VFPKRRCAAQRGDCAVEVDRFTIDDHFDVLCAGLSHVLVVPAETELWIPLEKIGQISDRCRRNADRLKCVSDPPPVAVTSPCFHYIVKCILVGLPVVVMSEARICDQRVWGDQVCERSPLIIPFDRNGDPAIFAGSPVHAVGRIVRIAVCPDVAYSSHSTPRNETTDDS
jgi:hypothetical protein